MDFYAFFGLATVAVAAPSLLARNNPPQPPCVYPYTKFVYSGCFADSIDGRALPFKADLEFNNATIEQCTAYCKGNNYRYAGLEYYGQCFCGTSVSAASASENECNLPCNGDPTQACGGHDRVSIYQDPTFPDADDIAISSDYLSLGCYTEGDSGRSLDYSQWEYLDASTMTTETCLDACGSKGFPFAGTEFGRECYCGVVLGNGTVPTDAGQCSTPCTGNSTQLCGGPDHLSLYVAKNLQSTDQCGPPVISSSISLSSTTTTTFSSILPSTSLTSTTGSSSSTNTTPCAGHYCPVPTTSRHGTTTTRPCVGYNCPVTSTNKSSLPPSSSKQPSSQSQATTSPCLGHYCPLPTTKKSSLPSSSTPVKTSSSCVGYHCSQPTTRTSSTPLSSAPTKPTLPCIGHKCSPSPPTHTDPPAPCHGYNCPPPPPPPAPTKPPPPPACHGYNCPPPLPPHSTSSTKKLSTLKTSTSKKATTSKGYGYGYDY